MNDTQRQQFANYIQTLVAGYPPDLLTDPILLSNRVANDLGPVLFANGWKGTFEEATQGERAMGAGVGGTNRAPHVTDDYGTRGE
ncbi:MAG: hypothetical protein M3348_01685 [Acidobacteriota bacterium]|nr:hypothetical protein [Acidobacteriota bacterium]